MRLEELIRDTDALTYLNSLKVTLTDIKKEITEQDEMREYMNHSADRIKKLMRKADNQYRLMTKIVNKEAPFASEVTIQDDEAFDEVKETMEDG